MKSRDEKIERFDFVSDHTSENIRIRLKCAPNDLKISVHEIRLRTGSPIMMTAGDKCIPLDDKYVITRDDIRQTFEFVTGSSVHSVLEEIRSGFITLQGGHRVGICGRVVTENERIATIRDISSLNFRIAHQIIGCADSIMPYITDGERIKNVLIVSPPSCGKTTMLRDIARQLSCGIHRRCQGVKVGIIDERGEICAMYRGQMQNDVGKCTDVLDMCPKALGIELMLRSMSPHVIVTDEITNESDTCAILKAHRTGVSIIASAHGENFDEIITKPMMTPLFSEQVFDVIFVLPRSVGCGCISVHIPTNEGKWQKV